MYMVVEFVINVCCCECLVISNEKNITENTWANDHAH